MMEGQPEWAYLQRLYRDKAIADKEVTQRIPTVILTSSKLNESNWWIGHSAEGKMAWRALHDSLIDRNPRAVHFVTDTSDHNVPLDNPGLTTKAIDTALYMVSGV
ncbi:hypothetical protein PVT67_07070 [Gallaecimonas kandeliae]|uniref:hypothetical protein n=1 Tax=Gallaecimonas kandeliae TaxID=3029055 RepID=UPI0026487A73|nr:hypothetical protein [Gallaecimonas kandeliae]WKE66991.1 hypothetical protein PVT67_07070 [Gallaecimonas kandeliae]